MDLQTAGEWRRGEQLQKFEEEWELEAAANEWSVIQLNWGLIIICLLHIDKYGETLKMPIAGFS